MVSHCIPGGLEFSAGTLGSAKMGVGPNNWTLGLLTWPEPGQVVYLNLGTFRKSHLKRDETHTESALWESRKREESSIHEQNAWISTCSPSVHFPAAVLFIKRALSRE